MNNLTHIGFCRFIYTAIFAIPIMASAANPHFEAAVKYIPEHSKILLGEPLFVTFSVTNGGANTFYLETGGDYRDAIRPGRYAFKATDADGVVARDPNPDARNFGGLIDFSEVKPHSTYSEKLFLPLWIQFDRAGRYLVHVERAIELYSTPSPSNYPHAAFTNSGTFDFYVTVLPANLDLLGKRIQQWGEQLKSPADAPCAAEALAEIKDDRVVPYLLQIATIYKGNALQYAIEGLGKHPGPASTRALIKMLGNPEYYYFQPEIIEALAKTKSSEAKAALRESLDAPDEQLRSGAAKLLGQSGDTDSIGAIKSHLMDTHFSVRLACANALVKLGAFDNGSNSPAILVQCLDTADPSTTNFYNRAIFDDIAACGGPNLPYHFAFHGESTETEIAENKKALAEMLRWAKSSNIVPDH
jgi:hypothetical protein